MGSIPREGKNWAIVDSECNASWVSFPILIPILLIDSDSYRFPVSKMKSKI